MKKLILCNEMTQRNAIFVETNMDMGAQLLRRYLWIVEQIRLSQRITFSELQRQWERKFETSLPRRTFAHNKEMIQDIFDINIECDRRTNEYYIELPDDLKRQTEINWILNSFSTLMELTDSRKISDRIVLEDIPSSKQFLSTVLDAIKQNQVLRITYHPFGKEASELEMNPYFVQLSANRWYLYGVLAGESSIKAVALDRFEKIEIVNKTFAMPTEFSPEQYLLDNGVGKYKGIEKCEVVIRAYGKQVDLLRTLPLHPSQCETKRDEEGAEFTYQLYPTTRFYSDILSAGEYVKVVRPVSVRKHLAEIINKMTTYYQ